MARQFYSNSMDCNYGERSQNEASDYSKRLPGRWKLIKALKITMATYAICGSLFGLFYLLAPQQAIAMQSPESVATPYLIATKMALGAGIFAPAFFAALAARDPIKNIQWLRYSIVNAALFLSVALYTGFVLHGDVIEAIVGIVIHGGFGTALFILYLRGAATDQP